MQREAKRRSGVRVRIQEEFKLGIFEYLKTQ
jgi:hypothetical protein